MWYMQKMGMRILQVCSEPVFAGTERFVVDTTAALLRRGHEVWIAGKRDGGLLEHARRVGLPVAAPPALRPWDGLRLAWFAWRHRVDVIHAHLGKAITVGCVAATLARIPLLAHAHIPSESRPYKLCGRRWPLLTCSDHLSRHFRDVTGIPASRVRTLHNFSRIHLEPEATKPRDELAAGLRRELQLPDRARLLTVAGRPYKVKGFDLAVRALPHILAEHPDVHLLMAGGMPTEESRAFVARLESTATDLGVRDHIHLLGFRTDIARLLRGSDVVMAPPRAEPFGLSVLEPMLLGTPVVATRVGGIPEMLTDDSLGELVEPDNPDALARAACRLLGDAARWSAVSAAAAASARERFSEEAILPQLEAIYASMIR